MPHSHDLYSVAVVVSFTRLPPNLIIPFLPRDKVTCPITLRMRHDTSTERFYCKSTSLYYTPSSSPVRGPLFSSVSVFLSHFFLLSGSGAYMNQTSCCCDCNHVVRHCCDYRVLRQNQATISERKIDADSYIQKFVILKHKGRGY